VAGMRFDKKKVVNVCYGHLVLLVLTPLNLVKTDKKECDAMHMLPAILAGYYLYTDLGVAPQGSNS